MRWLAVSIVLGSPFIALLYWLVRRAGPLADPLLGGRAVPLAVAVGERIILECGDALNRDVVSPGDDFLPMRTGRVRHGLVRRYGGEA